LESWGAGEKWDLPFQLIRLKIPTGKEIEVLGGPVSEPKGQCRASIKDEPWRDRAELPPELALGSRERF
jgi:hypothetical protein